MLFFCVGLGNWLKNVFLIPRPPSPRVWTPENVQKTDHGFPSTHTISFIAAPMYFLLYHYVDKFYQVPHYPLTLATSLLITILISGSIIFSRMYNGYHSPLDVAGGAVLGFSVCIIWYVSIRYWLDTLVMWKSFYVPLIILLISLSMVLLHPRPDEPTTALPESGMLFGTAGGVTIGAHLSTLFDWKTILGPPVMSSFTASLRETNFSLQLSRFILGMILVAISREIGKRSFTMLAKKLYPSDKEMNWRMTIVKFLNYWSIGFAICFWIMIIFHCVGLHTDYDLRPVTPFPTGFNLST